MALRYDDRSSRETRYIERILTMLEELQKVSGLSYANLITELESLGYPTSFARMSRTSDLVQLEAIETIVSNEFRRVQSGGTTFSGTVLEGTVATGGNPYQAVAGELVLADATANSFTVRLPDASTSTNEKSQVNVKLVAQAAANAVTVEVEGGGTIDGAASIILNVAGISYTFYVADGEYKVI